MRNPLPAKIPICLRLLRARFHICTASLIEVIESERRELLRGTLLQGIGGFYTAMDADGRRCVLRAQRKLKRARQIPKIGDYVEMTPGTGDGDGWIEAILPRRNELLRPPVANIDKVVLTASAAAPEADLTLIDRMLTAARRAGIEAMLAVTKSEMNPNRAREILAQYRGAGIALHAVSAVTGSGVDALRDALRGSVHAFAGQSGAGKSTLINALYALHQDTGDLSEKIERGKNTTRRCELIPVVGGGMVLDTPGFSLLETELIDPVELQSFWKEFEPYQGTCYFQPCRHASEPKCGVRAAVERGEIDPERHARYVALLNEMQIKWRERYD